MPLNTMETPGSVLGYRKNGSPIRVIAGGSEGAVENGTDGESEEQQQQGDGGQKKAPTAEDITRLQAALDKERQNSRTHAAAARELAALKASQQSDTEKAIAAARADAAKEVSARYTQRLAGLSIRAAAGGKFHNPEDAAGLLTGRLSEFVSEDGDVDDRAVAAAVDGLLKERPYLGAQKTAPDFDGGQRNGATGTSDMNTVIRRQLGLK